MFVKSALERREGRSKNKVKKTRVFFGWDWFSKAMFFLDFLDNQAAALMASSPWKRRHLYTFVFFCFFFPGKRSVKWANLTPYWCFFFGRKIIRYVFVSVKMPVKRCHLKLQHQQCRSWVSKSRGFLWVFLTPHSCGVVGETTGFESGFWVSKIVVAYN